MLGKSFDKKMFEKSFDKQKFGEINSKTTIFIIKLYSKIDKFHTIFSLLAPFDKQGGRQGVMKTSVAYDST